MANLRNSLSNLMVMIRALVAPGLPRVCASPESVEGLSSTPSFSAGIIETASENRNCGDSGTPIELTRLVHVGDRHHVVVLSPVVETPFFKGKFP